MSIHDKGKKVLEAFEKLPWDLGTVVSFGPRAGPRAKYVPDATVTYPDDTPVPVELKRSTTSVAQLRPLDYHVLVVWREREGWWVVPPNAVLEMATSYAGQHCISSFECFNPGKPNAKWQHWKCDPQAVPNRVRTAYEDGQKSSVRGICESMRREVLALFDRHRAEVLRAVQHDDED